MTILPPPNPNPNPNPALAVTATALWEKALVPATGGEAMLVVRIAAAPAPPTTRRAPVDVAFVLDRSGSMADGRLDLAKQAVDVAVSLLGEDDRAALVVYDHAVDTLHRLDRATARAKTAIRLALHGVDIGGSTNLSGGWLAGCGELSGGMTPAAGVRLSRALLLTDGHANVGITDHGELTHHAAELRQRGIATTTLGVGVGYDEDLLGGMAEAGGGNFHFVEHPHELRAIFAQELQDLLSIAATDLAVTLTLPPGVRGDLVNAFPNHRLGKAITVSPRDLAAGEELFLVFALRVRGGAPGQAYPVQIATSWTDPAADARREIKPGLAPLVLTDAATVLATPVDPVAAEHAAQQRAYAAQREAMRLDRAGQHAASRAHLGTAAQILAAAPMSAAIAEDLQTIEHLRDHDATVAYSEATRKRGHADALRRSRGGRNQG